MSYTINISRNGRHFLRTAADAHYGRAEGDHQLAELRQRFPASEGWEVTLRRETTTVETIDRPGRRRKP